MPLSQDIYDIDKMKNLK